MTAPVCPNYCIYTHDAPDLGDVYAMDKYDLQVGNSSGVIFIYERQPNGKARTLVRAYSPHFWKELVTRGL